MKTSNIENHNNQLVSGHLHEMSSETENQSEQQNFKQGQGYSRHAHMLIQSQCLHIEITRTS